MAGEGAGGLAQEGRQGEVGFPDPTVAGEDEVADGRTLKQVEVMLRLAVWNLAVRFRREGLLMVRSHDRPPRFAALTLSPL